MDEHLQYKAALSLAKRTLEFVADYRTPPTPHAYELFYTFAAGLNPKLSCALRNVLAEKGRLPSSDAEALHDKYLAPDVETQQIEEIAKKLSAEVTANLKLLGSAAVSTKQYETSLGSAEKKLELASEVPEAQSAVNALIAATREMAQTNAELVSNLNASRAQVEEMEQCLKLVREESSKDALTGLTNRKRFDLRLNEEILKVTQNGQPLSLLVLDVDHFKKFNDKFGHLAGDAVLRFVSSCIQSNIKGRDVAARFGGEEFTVVLIDTEIANATKLADQIRAMINSKELIRKSSGENLGFISVSVGVAEYQPDDSAESLFGRADECLLFAKRAGRNRVVRQRPNQDTSAPDAA